MSAEKKHKRFRISGKLIFNIIVLGITFYLITYFCVSENGMIDLLSSPDGFKWGWIIVGIIVFYMNIIIDTVVTQILLRTQYPEFRFIDSLKVALVGVFFGAVTPSNTGGQPMQLYLLSKMNVGVGFGSACMTQKFVYYQIVTGVFSVLAIIIKFDFFKSAFTNIWSTLFIVLGFLTQTIVTALFLIISFSPRITGKIIGLADKIIHKLKFIKNPDKKIKTIKEQVEIFHTGNKLLYESKKRMILLYSLVALQVIAILSVPYFVYLSFDMHSIAIVNNQIPLNFLDSVCIQSFVLFTSNLVPLPGASGGAELAFTMYFGPFFIVGQAKKIKPAILLWRFITYYGAILVSAPFSYLTKGKRLDDAIKENESQQIKTE